MTSLSLQTSKQQSKRAVDLVATGEIELGEIVADVDDVWDQAIERVDAFVLCGCSCRYGPDEKPMPQLIFCHTVCRDEERVQRTTSG